jgi:hypothetical protein
MRTNRYLRTTVQGTRVYVHRIVWRNKYGELPKCLQIHHKNGDRTDNRLSNLVAVTPQDHKRLHISNYRQTRQGWVKKCPICKNEYPVSDYSRKLNRGNFVFGVQSYCPSCFLIYLKKYRQRKGVI